MVKPAHTDCGLYWGDRSDWSRGAESASEARRQPPVTLSSCPPVPLSSPGFSQPPPAAFSHKQRIKSRPSVTVWTILLTVISTLTFVCPCANVWFSAQECWSHRPACDKMSSQSVSLIFARSTALSWCADVSPVSNQSSSLTVTANTGYTCWSASNWWNSSSPILCFLSPSLPGTGPQQTPDPPAAPTQPQLEDRSCTNMQALSGECVLFQHDRKWDLFNSRSVLTWSL